MIFFPNGFFAIKIFKYKLDKIKRETVLQTTIVFKFHILFKSIENLFKDFKKNLASEDTKPHLQCCRPPSRSFSLRSSSKVYKKRI